MWAHPGKQLLFMGAEFAQESEWAEARELDWWLLDHAEHRGVQALVRDLNRVYARHPGAVVAATTTPPASAGSTPTTPPNNVFSFVRQPERPGTAPLVCVANFAAVPHEDYRLGLPAAGAGPRCSTPTPTSTPARGSATSAGRRHRAALARAARLRDGRAASARRALAKVRG